MKNNRENLFIRLPMELKIALENHANKMGLTLNGLCMVIITEYLKGKK